MSQPLAILGGQPLRTRAFTSWPIFGEPEEQRLLRTLRSGKWGKLHGPEVAEFEQRFAAMHGAKHGIGVVNGTVSLRIALMAAGIKAEDEVIVPPYTFLATATAVVEANAVPVFADIDLETFNLDPKAVEAAITPRTRVIMPVHMAGQAADMDAIMAIAKRHKLVVIEDAAHAHGALYRQSPAGSIGQMGSFSFQSSKNLTSAGKAASSSPRTIRWRRPAVRFTTAGASPAGFGTNTTSCPPTTGWESFRARSSTPNWTAWKPKPRPAIATANTWPPDSAASRAFTRRSGPPIAPGTAIICSCSGLTRQLSARRARRCSRHWRRRESRFAADTLCRCIASRYS